MRWRKNKQLQICDVQFVTITFCLLCASCFLSSVHLQCWTTCSVAFTLQVKYQLERVKRGRWTSGLRNGASQTTYWERLTYYMQFLFRRASWPKINSMFTVSKKTNTCNTRNAVMAGVTSQFFSTIVAQLHERKLYGPLSGVLSCFLCVRHAPCACDDAKLVFQRRYFSCCCFIN